jgi:acetyl-CoA acetyltransferase family protein
MTLKHINTHHLYNQRIQQEVPGIYLGMDIENPATEFIKNVFNSMGQTAEIVAKKYGISRVAQDEYALLSQQRIAHAQTSGYFSSEIIPFPIQRQKKASTEIDTYILNQDECNKPDTNLDNLLALSPSFVDGGTATAGNSSQITDGASMCLLASDTFCDQHQLQRLGYFHGMVTAGCAPEEMGAGPLYAVKKLLKQHKLQISDVDLFEMNEAFASTTLYCQQSLRIPMEKLNVCGGAIGLGHPFGMTGSRLVGRILRDLKRLDKRLGIVTLCVGGGMGVAALVERA